MLDFCRIQAKKDGKYAGVFPYFGDIAKQPCWLLAAVFFPSVDSKKNTQKRVKGAIFSAYSKKAGKRGVLLKKQHYIAAAALLVSAIACAADYKTEYNVLDKVAETTAAQETEGEVPKAEIQADTSQTETESETEKQESETGLEEPETEGQTESETEPEMWTDTRPEYDPEAYTNTSKCDIKTVVPEKVTITDDEALKSIHSQMVEKGIYSDTDTAAKGDIINISYTVTDTESNQVITEVEDEDRVIGENLFPDEVDTRLAGTKEGDTVDADYTFAKEYPDDLYAGKSCHFHIVIHELRGMALTDDIVPALTDNAQQTAAGYLQETKELLAYQKESQMAEDGLKTLCDKVSVKSYPEETLNYDFQMQMIQLYSASGFGSESTELTADDTNTILQSVATAQGYTDVKEFLSSVRETVTQNLEQEMKVLALAKKYHLWLDDEALGQAILQQVSGYDTAEDYYADYSKYHARYLVAYTQLTEKIRKGGG